MSRSTPEMNHLPTSTTGNLPEVTVVMPCLNEAETLAICIEQVLHTFAAQNISGEIVVADNGSTDGSHEIAARMGARAVTVKDKGYGSALMGGIAVARGRYVIMGDCDASYDFRDIPLFLRELRAGASLVMGNRFLGGIQPGAMPLLHRYLGNPLLTGIGHLFFKNSVGDFHCGLRGFTKEAYEHLNMRTTGMEFASEMVVKATLFKLSIAEVPTALSPDRRSHSPHLRTWRDGWRHLRFLLLYSPRWLFLYPGLLLMLFGTVVGLWLFPGPRRAGNITLDIHTLLYAVMAILAGFQAVAFAVFTKIFAITEGLIPEDPRFNRLFRVFNLEVGLLAGLVLVLLGLGGATYSVVSWSRGNFGPLNPVHMVRVVAGSVASLTLGIEVVLSSFFLSILGMARK